ncbi:hypothetical protein EYR41_005029 [Orbilia oligospora]|uniref:Uncharacterized protein n=1 Tax=Orbilia oligospora TaxID=2813651 RepID=A0A8H2DXR0_ORBOL|nr:hypothetical protein EYR41_005029 [Orbilia oligospora]
MLALLPVQREGVAQGRSTPTRELGRITSVSSTCPSNLFRFYSLKISIKFVVWAYKTPAEHSFALGLCPRTQRIKHPQEAYGADLAGLVSWPLAINQTPQSHGLHEHTKASNLDMIQDELQFRWLSPVGLRPNPKWTPRCNKITRCSDHSYPHIIFVVSIVAQSWYGNSQTLLPKILVEIPITRDEAGRIAESPASYQIIDGISRS